MSWLRYMTLYSFRKLNPDWNMELYIYDTPIKNKYWKGKVEQDFFRYKGKDYFDAATKLVTVKKWKGFEVTGPSHQSNLFKWHILSTCGGIYADMDILWIKPFNIFDQLKQADVSLSCFGNAFHIGLLGATSNNPFFARILETAKGEYDPNEYQSLGVDILYNIVGIRSKNPGLFQTIKTLLLKLRYFALYNIFGAALKTPGLFQIVKTHFPQLRYFHIPKYWIYPYRDFEMANVFEKSEKLPEDCIGIHWYAGSEIAQKWNNRLTAENVKDFSSTMARCAGQIA